MNRIVAQEEVYPLQPAHIDASKHLWDSFGSVEAEVSAAWIVRFLQERNEGWRPFTEEEIEKFYGRAHKDGFRFNGLIDKKFIIVGDDGKYRVTHEFICNCFKASPATQEMPVATQS